MQGWFEYQSIYDKIIKEAKPHDKILEIEGTTKSICYLASRAKMSKKNLEIFFMSELCSDFQKHSLQSGVVDIINWLKTNQSIGKNYFKNESLFAAIIYGNTKFKQTTYNLDVWKSKIKKGGFLAGDNFIIPEVKEAVESKFNQYQTINEIMPAWFTQV